MVNATVRRGTIDDLDVIAALLSDVQRIHADALPHFFKPPPAEGFPAEMVRALVEEPEHLVLLAEESAPGHEDENNAVVVGYLYAVIKIVDENPFTYANKTCHIEHLSVRPDRQRAGHGTRLMQAVRTYAHKQGADRLTLDVWDFNAKAQRFFQEQGFAPARHRMVIGGQESGV